MSYRDALYKSNTVVQGGSNMSELDLSKKLEVGDLLVGECRCDPSKKGVIEVLEVIEDGERENTYLRFPNGRRLYAVDERYYKYTVGDTLKFIEECSSFESVCQTRRDYHNWKHIPKRDFTFEVGDILYGECACTPSKFVVFEVESIVGGDKNIRVVSCWNKESVGVRQEFSFSRIHITTTHGYNTLNSYLKSVLSSASSYNFNQYNYTKYTKAEWGAKKIEEQKRSASKFIDASGLKVGSLCGKDLSLKIPSSQQEYIFRKSDYKVTETDKEIRVASRPKRVSGALVVGTHSPSFRINEDEVELFFSDFETLLEKYKVEQ